MPCFLAGLLQKQLAILFRDILGSLAGAMIAIYSECYDSNIDSPFGGNQAIQVN